jgi:hypothetical protein
MFRMAKLAVDAHDRSRRIYRCELCGAWIELRDLGKVLAHEGPLPHPVKTS